MFHTLLRRIVFPLFKLFYRPKVNGIENLPTDSNYIIISNHLGKIDVFSIATLYREKIYFMAKKEWFKSKFSNKFFRWLGAIPVDRDNADITSIRVCFQTLKDGNKLVIFPEGTRNKANDGTLLPIKGGAGLIAFKSKVKVVPIVIKERYRFLRKNYINIGLPFDFSEFNGQKTTPELIEKFKDIMQEKLSEGLKDVNDFANRSKIK